MERACRVILIGMMGSGKTTVGRLLAEHTRWRYLDNDELLDSLVGKTPKQILAEDGEASLRAAETEALQVGLTTEPPAIVAVAAGTILGPGNRRALRAAGPVVWLRANAATVERRAMGAAHRPWLETGGLAWIRETLATRDPLYASAADLVVDVDQQAPDAVARRILDWLRHVEACRAFQEEALQS